MLLQEGYPLAKTLQVLGVRLMHLNKLLVSLRGLLCKEEVVSRHNGAIHLNANIANVCYTGQAGTAGTAGRGVAGSLT